ncbi:hypothetical protein evm_007802 [Chilo suppressalis]|nr:hypothetical protein evm_007802 [Chilo suppressalis]
MQAGRLRIAGMSGRIAVPAIFVSGLHLYLASGGCANPTTPVVWEASLACTPEKPDALVLNAGDAFQGTYWYTLLKWNIIQKFINMLPNDVHAIGNHEFDDGIAGLAPYLAALQAPVVVANIDTSKEPTLSGLYKPHVVLERKGRKIGVIGVTTPETATSSNSQGVIFSDPVEAVKREADILHKQGVDIIIVLSHCGLNVDKKMAKDVGENVDIIVGGHSHSLLWNGESPSNESISGPYPVTVEAKERPGHKVLVVTASAFTKYLGNITVYFSKDGELQSYEGTPVFLNRSIPEDPKIKEAMQPYKDELYSLVNEVVGFAHDDLISEPCGSKECAIGDIIADAYLTTVQERNVSDIPHVTFILRNMIRGSIAGGEINRGAVINVLPFTNKVVTVQIEGRHLLEALHRCMTSYWREKPFNGPWMPQVAGMQVILNTTDRTVVSAMVKEGDEFKPIDPKRKYQVVTLLFLTRGGNGFTMFRDNHHNLTHIGEDAKIVEDYIKKVTPLTPKIDNRLVIVN